MRWEKVEVKAIGTTTEGGGGGGPGKRWGHTCNAVKGGRLVYVFGGYGKDNCQTNQVHVFDTGQCGCFLIPMFLLWCWKIFCLCFLIGLKRIMNNCFVIDVVECVLVLPYLFYSTSVPGLVLNIYVFMHLLLL